jgi:hypothetical protein
MWLCSYKYNWKKQESFLGMAEKYTMCCNAILS